MPTTLANHEALAACDRLAQILERSAAMQGEAPAPKGDDAVRVPLVRYALGIVRGRLRPALQPGWAAADPVHVAMFGGTNSGKSTVLNLLLGRPAAGMNSLARFSQHPEAYRPERLGDAFLEGFPTRFAGYARYRDRHPPRQADGELRARGYVPALAVNDPEHLGGPALAAPASAQAVFWDIPDFSTEEAATYMPAVLDTVAVADLVVMAVTQENYADHRGALLRALIADSGVPLRVVANKLEPGSALLDDIHFKLGGGIALGDDAPGRRVPPERVQPLPHVRGADDDARLAALVATPEAAALRRAVADDVAGGAGLKRRALAGALEFLDRRLDDLLAPLKAEVTVAEQWALTVERLSGREFYDRHRRHYLNDEKYVDFNQTLVKLMDRLEIPGVGPYISALSRGIRSVSRLVIGGVVNLARAALGRPNPKLRRMPEEEVVIDAFERWYEALKAEAQLRADEGGHPAWRTIARKLGSHRFYGTFVGDLAAAYQGYRERMDRITAERAQAIYEAIATKPRLLNTLRGVKATLDVGTTGLIVASHGLDWTDAVIAPLVAPVQRLLLEFGLQKVLDAERARLKAQQVAAFRDVIDERMVRPVRELFRGAVRPEDLHAARRDLEALREALAVAGGLGR
jgi:hypothetical protein